MMSLAIYPGSFDPITNGHIDLIERADNIFDRVEVAVADNMQKKALLTVEERVELIREVIGDWNDVAVNQFDGLLVEFVRSRKANVILRGLRAVSDFEYEFQMSMMNKRLASKIETVYMMTGEDHSFVSSSTVKEVARLGGDISSVVPRPVEKKLKEKFQDNT
ncbi:MAG: pantetheine-phosphate adenylyltransferase [bacterium]